MYNNPNYDRYAAYLFEYADIDQYNAQSTDGTFEDKVKNNQYAIHSIGRALYSSKTSEKGDEPNNLRDSCRVVYRVNNKTQLLLIWDFVLERWW